MIMNASHTDYSTLNGIHDSDRRDDGLSDITIPVLIVGGGPTGLLQAYMLSQLGVKNMIIERYQERLGAPKAHALSPRSLEICRQFGLDVSRIRSLGTARKDAFWVNFVTNLAGQSVGVLPYERMDAAVLDDTPEMIHNIPQPVFEQFLTDMLSRESNVDIRKGISFVSLRQDGDEVILTVEERATGARYDIRSRHVIACDGARSKVRNLLQIESDGEDSYETMMTIHFNANLRPVVGERVGMLHWIMDPVAAGFIIAYDLEGNQVLISNFDAEKHPVESWNEDLCRFVVTAAIGANVPFDVLSYRPWLLSRKVAKQYRVGNVFLAGDAAHSFPPTGGLGLNSGLADVHNLAYKIAAVHQGWAAPSILDSYQADRRWVAEVNSRQSVKNGQKIFGLLKTLGTAGIHDNVTARKNLYASLSDPEKKRMIDAGIEDQREHFDNLELHIGYVYGQDEVPPHASKYVPRYIQGARLPHAWITLPSSSPLQLSAPVDLSYVPELTAEERKLRQFTTLDLCAPSAFTLIIGSWDQWRERIEKIKTSYQHNQVQIVAYSLGIDFNLVPGHLGDSWMRGSGLTTGGGLLVRPDQHILKPLMAESSAEDVLESLKIHLGQ